MTGSNDESVMDEDFLARGLMLVEGFALYIVSVETPNGQQRIIDRLNQTQEFVVDVLDVALSEHGLILPIVERMEALSDRPGKPVVEVIGLDELLDRKPMTFARLNEHRNTLIHWAPGGIVLIGGPKILDAIRRAAPDTWSVRAADIKLDEDVQG